MSCQYATTTRAGQTLDVLTDEGSGTRLTVNRLGAAPVSFARRTRDGGWTGFLWRDDDLSAPAAGWNGHCTVMGYYIHRLFNERTTYRGHELRGGTHSFLRHKTFRDPEFAVDAEGHATLTYTLTPADYEGHEYPYRVTLHLVYTLEPDGAWRTRFRFESGEPDVSTHVSFGLHPGFAVGSLASAEIILPPGTYRRHLAPGNFLSGETEDLASDGGPFPFDKARLVDSYLLEPVDTAGRIFSVDDPADGRRVEVDCSQAPYVTIWSDGHDFVCVEPCWGLPDAQRQVPFEQKEGIQEIPPGGTLERGLVVRAGFHR